MRAYLTGGHGFVGQWLCRHLETFGDTVVAPDESVDITDKGAISKALISAEPEVIFHLAALSHVGESWAEPGEVFRVNAEGTLNVVQASLELKNKPRVIVVSSAEVYGIVSPSDLPLHENSETRPVTPYAGSKLAAEVAALQAFRGSGADVVVVRPFNHVGPMQSERFVVSALAKRIVEAVKSGASEIKVGNLDSRRDYTDVRDVVRAYRLLAKEGQPGEIYNICSGFDRSVREVADVYLGLAQKDIKLVKDESLTRNADVPVLRGDNAKVRQAVGWQPEIVFEDTLRDTFDYWLNAQA